MSFIESQYTWNFTSTGTGKFLPLGPCQSVTFGIETSTNSTATVQILHRMGSTVGPAAVLSTVQTGSTGAFVTDQFLGPLEYVAPRVVDKTAGGATNTVTVYVRTV